MGVTLCPTHGRQYLALVSPAVRAALDSARPDAAGGLRRVRYVYDDEQYPPGSMWLDPEFAREASLATDGVANLFELDEGWVGRLQPVCHRCLEEWLRRQGADTAPSTEEGEFIRIRDTLRGELDSTLRAFLMSSDAVERASRRLEAPSARWFDAKRGWPLVAGVKTRTVTLRAMCKRQDDGLVCTSSVSPISGPTVEGPSAMVGSALDETARRTLQAWAQDVLNFLVSHTEADAVCGDATQDPGVLDACTAAVANGACTQSSSGLESGTTFKARARR